MRDEDLNDFHMIKAHDSNNIKLLQPKKIEVTISL